MDSNIDDITQGATDTAVGGWGDKSADEKSPDEQTQASPEDGQGIGSSLTEGDTSAGHENNETGLTDNQPDAQYLGQQMQQMGAVPAGFSADSTVWSPGSPMPGQGGSDQPGQTDYRYSWQE